MEHPAQSASAATAAVSSFTRQTGSDENTPAYLIRHDEISDQWLIAFSAHAVDLSVWHEVHGLAILYLSVIAGEMNRKVWA